MYLAIAFLLLVITPSIQTFNESYFEAGKKAIAEHRLADAERLLQQSLKEDPNHLQTLFYLALVHYDQQQFYDALHYFRQYAVLSPGNKGIMFNIGLCLDSTGQFDEAQKMYESVLRIVPDHQGAKNKLWCIYLRNRDRQKGQSYVTSGSHWWYDSDIQGKRILLRYDANHGFGDVLTYMRYAKHLKKAGAYVIIQCRPTLVRLLSECAPYVDQVCSLRETPPSFDCVYHGSPVLNMVCESEKISHDTPYISAKPELISYWKEKLASDKKYKVGICWSSVVFRDSADYVIPNPRNISLQQLMPLLEMPNVSFYSLQKVNGLEELALIPDGLLHNLGNELDTQHGPFMDTAALMHVFDLVITIDTSIAHLAGASGVPVWTMIPYASCWRWFDDYEESSLYPSMRLFRQSKFNDWESVVRAIKNELQNRIEPKRMYNQIAMSDRLSSSLEL